MNNLKRISNIGVAVVTAAIVLASSSFCNVQAAKATISSCAGGSTNSFMVDSKKQLWVRGGNSDGQLGIGNQIDQPKFVKGIKNVISVSSGGKHTLFLKKDKTLWASGLNNVGQLGINSKVSKTKPVKVMSKVISYSADYSYNAAVKKDGTLWAWGHNPGNQIPGKGITVLKPVKIAKNCKTVITGRYGIYAIKKDKSFWDISKNKKIATKVIKAAGGREHFAFIKKNGDLYTFGLNNFGQLGNNPKKELKAKTKPVRIAKKVSDISLGNTFTVFVKKDGTAWGAGRNELYQFGAGKNKNYKKPVKIMSKVKRVFAGDEHMMLIKKNKTVWGVGSNSNRQIKDSSADTVKSFVQLKV